MALSPADFSLALKSDFMATDSHDRVNRAGVWILTTSFIYTVSYLGTSEGLCTPQAS